MIHCPLCFHRTVSVRCSGQKILQQKTDVLDHMENVDDVLQLAGPGVDHHVRCAVSVKDISIVLVKSHIHPQHIFRTTLQG